MSFFRRIFRVGQEEPKRKTYANIKRGENPELIWDTVGELGDGAFGKVYKVMSRNLSIKFFNIFATFNDHLN